MSEVDKHYATGPVPSGRRPGQGAPGGRSPSGRDGDGSPMAAAARVAGSVRASVGDAYENAGEWSRDRYGKAASWASENVESVSRNTTYARRRSAAEFNRGRRTVESFVEENPIMVGVVGVAAGLLIGALLPGTRRENQYFGRYADEVRDQGLRYAQEVAEQGRHVVEENLSRLSQAKVDRDTGDETNAR